MIEALKESLPMAIGLALSPVPIVTVIILLMTPRAKVNAPGLLLGWYLGLHGWIADNDITRSGDKTGATY